jgi:succinoglycan biosynthesis transport protein ExoP
MTRSVEALQYRDHKPVPKHKSGALQRRVTPMLLDRLEVLSLCYSIVVQLPRDRPRIIQITSSVHGEGTSTIAREIALTVARDAGLSVLLVTVTSNGVLAPGLEAVARSSDQFDGAIELDQDVPLLSRATLSVGGNNAGLLFDFAALDRVYAMAVRHAKLVIIDAPPVLADLSSAALSPRAAGVVLVVEAERTRAPLVEQSRRVIEKNGGRLLGAVMNKRQFHIPGTIYRRL